MLRVGQARNWDQFRAAFSSYALPGLQFNAALHSGQVGSVMGVRIPRRGPVPLEDLPTAPDGGWEDPVGWPELPVAYDPPEGFVAAANARPDQESPPIGYFFSPPDRKRRLGELTANREKIAVENLMALQRDTHLERALTERDLLLSWLGEGAMPEESVRRVYELLKNWNGDYDTDSEAALALELVSCHLARRLVPQERREAYDAAWGTRALTWQDFLAADAGERTRAIGEAFRETAKQLRRWRTWGSFHRLRLMHFFGSVPIAGRGFRYADLPAPGNSETLMKTAHGMTDRRHAVAYGSVARHISDLSDPDRNFFCLLGGEDGWLGSTTLIDQVAFWQRGEYITLPLRPETARATFPHCTRLNPPAA